MPHTVPPEVAAAIVAEYTAGAYTGTLAAKYGYSTSTLHRVYAEAGVTADRARSGAASWVRRTGLPPDVGDQQTGFRWCSACRERKPMDDFYWTSPARTSRMRICKPCKYRRNKSVPNLRGNRRKHMYGLTKEGFDRLWAEQEGRCAICRDPLADEPYRLHVDHCHETGAVRGLLCGGCNVGLGNYRDDPKLLRAAADYLESRRSLT